MRFERVIGEIYRLKVPFEDIYTSIFLVRAGSANLLVDSATFDSDIDEYLLPALEKLGLSIADITHLVLTHLHSDHAGGRERIQELNPKITTVRSADDNLPSGVSVYELKGHTLDFIGVFDNATGTLISGDGLQGEAIGRYRCSLESKEEYSKTLAKLQADRRIKNLLFSHDYKPWERDGAFGRAQVEKTINDCKNIIGEL